jgi:hypothetical protein
MPRSSHPPETWHRVDCRVPRTASFVRPPQVRTSTSSADFSGSTSPPAKPARAAVGRFALEQLVELRNSHFTDTITIPSLLTQGEERLPSYFRSAGTSLDRNPFWVG